MKRIYFLLVVICISFLSFSQNKKLNFKKGINTEKKESLMPSRSVSESKNYIEINYNFEDADVIDIKHDTDQFQLIRVKGFGVMGDVGKPALPFYNDILVVPQKEGLKIKIIEADYQEYDNFYIQPALEPQIDSENYPDTKIKIDKLTYSSNSYFPKDIVEIASVQIYRDIPLAFVQISPIQFNPKTKKIRCYSNIKYRIAFDGSNTTNSSTNRKESLAILKNVVLNPKSLESSLIGSSGLSRSISSVSTNSDTTYLIITTDEFLPAAEEFAYWKTITGYRSDIVSQASWTSSQVRNVVRAKYSCYKPEYLLIIGDHEDVPGQVYPHNNGDYPTDLYYTCMDGTGDFTSDIAHGRIPVESLEEAFLVLRKIINYERNSPADNGSFYQTGVHCAYFQDNNSSPTSITARDTCDGYEDRRFVLTCEEIRDYLTDSIALNMRKIVNRVYFAEDTVFPTNYKKKSYSDGHPISAELRKDIAPFYPWNGNNIDIINEINSGRFYVLHRDHGVDTAWSHPYFHVTDISSLSNGDKLPVIFSIECQSGRFLPIDYECLAEKFIRHPGGGAVGVFAASQISYSGYNDALAVGMFDAIWSEPGLLPRFGKFLNPTVTQHSDIYKMGNVLNQGLLRMRETWGNSGDFNLEYTNRIFHYFGDPSMEMYTASPSTFSNVIISENGSSVSVNTTGVSNCKITICSMIDMGKSCYEVADSVSSHTFSITQASKPYSISITKHNYKPYLYPQDINLKDVYIQNQIFSSDSIVTGRNIFVGDHVTDNQMQGPVIIKSGTNVKFRAEQNVLLNSGFKTEVGSSFEIEKR